jgi:hypothetical protein
MGNQMSSKPVSEQRRLIQEARLKAFACAYIVLFKTQGSKVARKAAALAVGVRNERTAKWYLDHPVVMAEIKKHFDALILKYSKTADDVLDGIAKKAFPDKDSMPNTPETHGDQLRALGMLAQHHKLINRASEGDEDEGETIRVYIPDNKRNPTNSQVMVGVKFYDKPQKAIESKEDE